MRQDFSKNTKEHDILKVKNFLDKLCFEDDFEFKEIKGIITDIINENKELTLSGEDYRTMLENSKDTIWCYDFECEKFILTNKFQAFINERNLTINNPLDFINYVVEDDRESVRADIKTFLRCGDKYDKELKICDGFGNELWVRVVINVVTDNQHNLLKLVGSFRDVSSIKIYEKEMNIVAHYDRLTGFHNKRSCTEAIQKKLENMEADNKGNMAILFLDLDNFKFVNDVYGYNVGDEILKVVARRIKGEGNNKEKHCRFRGDEFVIIINDYENKDEIIRRANEILSEIEKTINIEGKFFYLTVSIGIEFVHDNSADVEEVIRNAETALHHSKDKGKNIFSFYKNTLTEEKLRKLMIEEEMNKAIDNDEFFLLFQPKIDITDNRISGCESLIRWRSKEKGMIYPDQFIPIAEECGFIKKIDMWVLKESISHLVEWDRMGIEIDNISINISPQQFNNENFVGMVEAIFKGREKYINRVVIEITENTFVQSFGNASKALGELQRLGFKIALDDFGKGYSSLNYLKNLPIDILKIDKSFIDDIKSNGDELVDLIINIAHRLQLKIVAEGVETRSQLDYLRENKCDIVQGYYFSRPVESEQFKKYYRDFDMKNY